MITGFVMTKRK